jgi:hypothetical protein
VVVVVSVCVGALAAVLLLRGARSIVGGGGVRGSVGGPKGGVLWVSVHGISRNKRVGSS